MGIFQRGRASLKYSQNACISTNGDVLYEYALAAEMDKDRKLTAH